MIMLKVGQTLGKALHTEAEGGIGENVPLQLTKTLLNSLQLGRAWSLVQKMHCKPLCPMLIPSKS